MVYQCVLPGHHNYNPYCQKAAHIHADDILCHALQQFCPFGKELVDLYDEVDKWYS